MRFYCRKSSHERQRFKKKIILLLQFAIVVIGKCAKNVLTKLYFLQESFALTFNIVYWKELIFLECLSFV